MYIYVYAYARLYKLKKRVEKKICLRERQMYHSEFLKRIIVNQDAYTVSSPSCMHKELYEKHKESMVNWHSFVEIELINDLHRKVLISMNNKVIKRIRFYIYIYIY